MHVNLHCKSLLHTRTVLWYKGKNINRFVCTSQLRLTDRDTNYCITKWGIKQITIMYSAEHVPIRHLIFATLLTLFSDTSVLLVRRSKYYAKNSYLNKSDMHTNRNRLVLNTHTNVFDFTIIKVIKL